MYGRGGDILVYGRGGDILRLCTAGVAIFLEAAMFSHRWGWRCWVGMAVLGGDGSAGWGWQCWVGMARVGNSSDGIVWVMPVHGCQGCDCDATGFGLWTLAF